MVTSKEKQPEIDVHKSDHLVICYLVLKNVLIMTVHLLKHIFPHKVVHN